MLLFTVVVFVIYKPLKVVKHIILSFFFFNVDVKLTDSDSVVEVGVTVRVAANVSFFTVYARRYWFHSDLLKKKRPYKDAFSRITTNRKEVSRYWHTQQGLHLRANAPTLYVYGAESRICPVFLSAVRALHICNYIVTHLNKNARVKHRRQGSFYKCFILATTTKSIVTHLCCKNNVFSREYNTSNYLKFTA